MNLYEIREEMMKLFNEDGELLDEQAFQDLELSRTEKIENTALLIKNKLALISAYEDEIKVLKARKKIAENLVERLTKYLQDFLNGETVETAKCKISYRKSTPVNIIDEKQLIEWCFENYREDLLRFKDPEINKEHLKLALQSNQNIPFAEILENQNMNIK